MSKKEVLNKTADFIEDNILGNIIFYTVLLATPLATTLTVADLSYTDLDDRATEASATATDNYLEQIAEFKVLKKEYKQLDNAIDEYSGSGDILGMQEKQREIWEYLSTETEDFAVNTLTDIRITEHDYDTISDEYNSFAIKTDYGYMPNMSAGVLEECRAPAFENGADKNAQSKAISGCMLEEGPSGLKTFLIFLLPILSYGGLLMKGVENDSYRTSMVRQTGSYLRKKAEKIKSANKY